MQVQHEAHGKLQLLHAHGSEHQYILHQSVVKELACMQSSMHYMYTSIGRHIYFDRG